MKYSKPLVTLTASALALSLGLSAQAQTYPSRPVTLIIPYAAGGVADVAFRAIAQDAVKVLGQPIVVENRVGAGGKVGAEAIMRAPKDGYTFGVFNSGIAVNLPLMDPSFKIEPEKDYAPISRAIETYVVLIASPTAPFKDVRGLLEYARANPGKLNVGTAGVGTTGHLSLELLKHLAKVDLTQVPYKGDALSLNDVMGGQIPLAFMSNAAKPQVDAGKVRGIAVTSPQRWALFSDVPSFQEQGVKGFVASSWLGFVGPAGLQPDALAKLNRSVGTALQDAELRKKLAAMGLSVQASTPKEFGAFIRKDLEVWGPVIRAANIKLN